MKKIVKKTVINNTSNGKNNKQKIACDCKELQAEITRLQDNISLLQERLRDKEFIISLLQTNQCPYHKNR